MEREIERFWAASEDGERFELIVWQTFQQVDAIGEPSRLGPDEFEIVGGPKVKRV